MASHIPDSFLRGPPQGATVYRIDFEKTSPPIIAYKNHFAAVIDNFMTESECKELLTIVEDSITPRPAPTDPSRLHKPVWERAMVNAGGGKEVMSVDTRKSGRCIYDSHDMAQRLLDRLMPFLRDFNIDIVNNQPQVTGLGPARRGEEYHLTRLNERLRFLRYEVGDYFRPHWDGCYVTPNGRERSLFTIHLYLNGDGEQDLSELFAEIDRTARKQWLYARDGEVDLMEVAADESDVRDDASAPALDSLQSSEKLLGGATSFTDNYRTKEAVRVFPKAGSVLIFQQRNLMHGGDDIFRGMKYTMRTDVMYSIASDGE